MVFLIVFFFFFKQKTAYEMRISDWSSDVCSSDLLQCRAAAAGHMDDAVRAVALDGVGDRDDLAGCQQQPAAVAGLAAAGGVEDGTVGLEAALVDGGDHRVAEIGRAACRERVCRYV